MAAIGEATAQALRNSGFERVISPLERHDSEQLLARDQRNRFVPWQDLAAVRLPGALGPYRATFELRDGSRFRLWATDARGGG